MERCLSGCVGLDEACKVLVKSRSVQAIVKKAVGVKDYPTATHLMKSGNLEGDLGARLKDLLPDTLINGREEVWTGYLHNGFPIYVYKYDGVFWVWAIEYNPVGYFLDEESAVSFAQANWGDVHEKSEGPKKDADSDDTDNDADDDADDDEDSDDTGDDGEIHCPYCDTTDDCDHLLLLVDITFRHGEGGLLYDAFNSRWADILNEASNEDEDRDSDEDADFEGDSFDELLDEVRSISDVELTPSPDSAPGMSSNYGYYFCSSKKKAVEALKKFSKF